MATAIKVVFGLLTFVTIGMIIGTGLPSSRKMQQIQAEGYLPLSTGIVGWGNDKEAALLRLGLSSTIMVTPTLSQRADAVDEKIGEVETRLQTIEHKFDLQETHLKTIAEKIGAQETTIERAVQAPVAGVLEVERKRTKDVLARTTTRLEERIDRFRIEHERLAAIERENNLKLREEIKKTIARGQGTRPPPVIQPIPINVEAEGSHNQGNGENEECDYLRAIALPRLQVSTVVDTKTGKGVRSEVRTSSGMFLHPDERKYPLIEAIEKRISVYSQVPAENGELIQVLRYEKDQFYKPHHDYFSDSFNVKRGGQRVATMLMYLSDNVEGGETYFPMAGSGECSCGGKMVSGMSVKPLKGDAVLFWSMGLDGQPDPRSLHGGCEVLSGEKWSATKWMRQRALA
uniref:Fe2OG dioxygenase domain-containing protein n=1 Tax=Chenopodium quinoa TaxID=63459 RepID=A0A803MY32_CHEQI